MSVRTVPDTRPGQRHYRPEVPALRQQAAYRCDRNHGFEVTFAAGAELPQAFGCRCGAQAHQAGGQAAPPAKPIPAGIGTPSADGKTTAPGGEHDRRMAQLRGRRSEAELEQILADRLAEVAAMRKAGRTGP